MRLLSGCLFEWDEGDFDNLMAAKREELVRAGVSDTAELIEALLLAMSPATNALGVKLFNDEMMNIWSEQKQHVMCLQDPPGISLYTITGNVTKGGDIADLLLC